MDTLLRISVEIHGILRWLILLIALAGIVRTIVGLARQERFGKLDNGLSSGYSGILDLQMLLGIVQIVLLVALGASGLRRLVVHPLVMFLAVLISHLSAAFKRRDGFTRLRMQLGIYVGSLIAIVVGLAVIEAL